MSGDEPFEESKGNDPFGNRYSNVSVTKEQNVQPESENNERQNDPFENSRQNNHSSLDPFSGKQQDAPRSSDPFGGEQQDTERSSDPFGPEEGEGNSRDYFAEEKNFYDDCDRIGRSGYDSDRESFNRNSRGNNAFDPERRQPRNNESENNNYNEQDSYRNNRDRGRNGSYFNSSSANRFSSRNEPEEREQFNFEITRSETQIDRKIKFDFYEQKTQDQEVIQQFNERNELEYHSGLPELEPMLEFSDIIPEEEVQYINDKLNYYTPTPIEEAVIPLMISGRDTIAICKTGSGKSFIFTYVASLHCNAQEQTSLSVVQPICVVLSPTRELAIELYQEFEKLDEIEERKLNIACIYGGEQSHIEIDELRGKLPLDVLIATPGRIADFYERGVVSLERVSFIICDEADEMLSLGFKQEIDFVFQKAEKPYEVSMFSATWPDSVKTLSEEYMNLDNASMVKIASSIPVVCAEIKQDIRCVKQFSKKQELLEILSSNKDKEILVFLNSKEEICRLLDDLEDCQAIHGDLPQFEREQIINSFKKNEFKVLISTDLLSRGMDIENLEIVVNYDMPSSIYTYVHRCGRTGRNGKSGLAISFFDRQKDSIIVPELIAELYLTKQSIPEELAELGKSL